LQAQLAVRLKEIKKGVEEVALRPKHVKIVDGGLGFYFLFSLYFIFYFIFLFFSIFRTTWVKVYQSHCHISHKLMAKSQD